jgi:5,10-methylenetetrahydromethanopterin reductase
MSSPEHTVVAESLGYRRAWFYDSPALYPDVWIQLARAAERTSTIGLGPGVLIPSLRHPMATASAIGTLVEIAGSDRVMVGVGSGFTGRYTLGKKPLAWATVAEWVRTVRGLLRGETVTWDGARIAMMHPDGFGPTRPIGVPFVIGASGPKGLACAAEVADGVFLAGSPGVEGFGWQVCLIFGTVLDEGEPPTSPRVIEAGGHGVAVSYHYMDAHDMDVSALPGGTEWLAAYADVPAAERHLAVHDLHLIGVNERDRPIVTGELISMFGGAYSAAQLRERVAGLQASGITELAYQPAGPDIARELDAFMTAVG